MGEFRYKAQDARGRIYRGLIKASSLSEARQKLLEKRFRPLSVKPQTPGALGGFKAYKDSKGQWQIQWVSPPEPREMVLLTRQMGTLLASGVPLLQALDLLSRQQTSIMLSEGLKHIQTQVTGGSSLSEAMEGEPRIFDSLYTSMIKAGEMSGKLDAILMKLTQYIEKSSKIKRQIRSALAYPTFIAVFASLMVWGLLTFIVPTFAEQYKENGRELPGLTQWVILLSDTLSFYGVYVVSGFSLLGFLFFRWIRTREGKWFWDHLWIKAPVLGVLIQKVAIERFCSTLSHMLSAGVHLLEALQICAGTSGNLAVESVVLVLKKDVEGGMKISEAMGKNDIFPDLVKSMVSVGETTGALDDMLEKISNFYEEEVSIAVQSALALIEPIMIVVVGGIVGFIVLAMYLPVFDMAGNFS